MKISTATSLVALSCLTFMTTTPFNGNGGALVSATLTPEERIEVETKDPGNPNYCPACLKKAMSNHFPHACLKELDPMDATARPEGPTPVEQRCVCLAFVDLSWMKADCMIECPFVLDPNAMQYFVPADSIPGCEKWVDFEKNEEKLVEGHSPRDPNYKPEIFTYESDQATQETPSQEEEISKEPIEEDSTEPVESEESIHTESIAKDEVTAEAQEETRESIVKEDAQDVVAAETEESVEHNPETDAQASSVVVEAEPKIEEDTEKVEIAEPAPLEPVVAESTEAEAESPIADAQDDASTPRGSSNVKDEL